MRYSVKHSVKNDIQFESVSKRLKQILPIEMAIFNKRAERKMRQILKAGQYKQNSPPWARAKGSARPLYHTGHLSTMIKGRIIPGTGDIYIMVELGWLDNKPHPERPGSKGGLQDIIAFLTKKREWQPRRSSVKAFWARVPNEWKRSNPPQFKETWVSPKRDFMTDVWKNADIQMHFRMAVGRAVSKALSGR